LQEVRPELPAVVVRGDLLYVSYPCEHAAPGAGGAVDDDVDAYRGVFRGFMHSRTQACVRGGRRRPAGALCALPLLRRPRVECDGCGPRAAASARKRAASSTSSASAATSTAAGWPARVSDSDDDGERDGADCSGSLSDDNEFGAVAASEEYYGSMAL
jgi:hypothetical protein